MPGGTGAELMTIAKGAGIGVGGTVVGSGFRYAFQVLAARSLGSELLGLFFLGFAVFKISRMIAELGLANGVVRYVALYNGVGDLGRVKGIVSLGTKWAAVSGLAVGVLLALLARPLAIGLFARPELTLPLRLFAVALPFSAAGAMLLFATQGFKVMKYQALVREIFEPGLRLALAAAFFALGMEIYGAVIASVAPLILSPLPAWYYLKKLFPALRDRRLKPVYEAARLRSFSWPLLFVQFIGLAVLWTDTLMLGYFRTAGEVGIYVAAHKTALLGSVVITSFAAIFGPVISDFFNRREEQDLRRSFQGVTKWILTFSLPIYLFLVFFRAPILEIFGPEFTAGGSPLAILCLGWLVSSAIGPVGQMIIMTGRQKLHFLNMSGLMVINISLNLVLIPGYGIVGAAAATALSISALSLAELWQINRLLRIQPFRRDFLKPLAAGAVSLAALAGLERFAFELTGVAGLAAGFLLLAGFYTGIILVLGLGPEDRIVLNRLKKKFFEKIPS